MLRVEDARKKLKVDDETTLNVFRHYLPHAMLLKLDDLQVMAAMIAGKRAVRVSWSVVLDTCIQALNGTRFAEMPMPEIPPQADFIATSTCRPCPTEEMGAIDFVGITVAHPCELCAMVGRTAASGHELKDCFANPLSPKCKPAAYRTRVTELINRGLPILDYMRTPPEPKTEVAASTCICSSDGTRSCIYGPHSGHQQHHQRQTSNEVRCLGVHLRGAQHRFQLFHGHRHGRGGGPTLPGDQHDEE